MAARGVASQISAHIVTKPAATYLERRRTSATTRPHTLKLTKPHAHTQPHTHTRPRTRGRTHTRKHPRRGRLPARPRRRMKQNARGSNQTPAVATPPRAVATPAVATPPRAVATPAVATPPRAVAPHPLTPARAADRWSRARAGGAAGRGRRRRPPTSARSCARAGAAPPPAPRSPATRVGKRRAPMRPRAIAHVRRACASQRVLWAGTRRHRQHARGGAHAAGTRPPRGRDEPREGPFWFVARRPRSPAVRQ